MSAAHYSQCSARKLQRLNKSCEMSVKKYEGGDTEGHRAAGAGVADI